MENSLKLYKNTLEFSLKWHKKPWKFPKSKIKEKQNKNSEWIKDYSIKFIGTGKGSGKKKREAKRAACYNMITIFLKNTKTSKNNS